jgi:AcrR family transcriptional regulator
VPRPKAYDHATVVRAARDLFWARGYEATSLADLEQVTGLNRSSIYQEFGSKHGLFTHAIDNYLAEIAEPRLAGLRRTGAGVAAVTGYFTALAAALRDAPRHGCLMVNAITELAGHDADVDTSARSYRAQITEALVAALRHDGIVDAAGKAAMLTGLVLGILVTARLDTGQAVELAEAAAGQTREWS